MKFFISCAIAVSLGGCRTTKQILLQSVEAPPRSPDHSPVVSADGFDVASNHYSIPIFSIIVKEGSFTDTLYGKIAEELRFYNPFRDETGSSYTVETLNGEADQDLVEECRKIIQDKLDDSSYYGRVYGDAWESDDPGEGSFRLSVALLPVLVGREVHCFRFDIAGLNIGDIGSASKSAQLFLKQDPLKPIAWQGDDRHLEEREIPGVDDKDRVVHWLRETIQARGLGLRALEVIGVENDGELELKHGEVRFVVLKRKGI